jgi:Domain of unknown function (DUF4249)
MKKYFFIGFVAVALFTSCSEDINLSITGDEGKLVIEGSIENGQSAEVIITRNSPLSQAVDFSKILVTDAIVYVSDGITTDTLRLDTLLTTSVPFVYTGGSVIGVPGRSYLLTVIVDGKTYTANTTIPGLVALDSVWWEKQLPEDSLGFAYGRLSELPGEGNNYRWFAKKPTRVEIVDGNPVILNRRFIAPIGSAFDDKFIDGKSFDFAYTRGNDATEATYNVTEPENERGYYRNTDTIYVKFCTIDRETFQFYSTYEQALQSNGNPFASPVSILGNISNDALGVWAGYGATYDTILPVP